MSLFSSSSSADRDEDTTGDAGTTHSTSIISEGAKIEGILEFTSADLHIEGTVHGDISTDGRVIVSEGAEVQGTIHAHTIRVAGYVEGHLRAEDQLDLCPESEVHATLEADVLEIQPGANFTGEVPDAEEMSEEAPSSSPVELGSRELIPVPQPSRPDNTSVGDTDVETLNAQ